MRGTPESRNPKAALIAIKFDLAVSLCGEAVSNSKTADLARRHEEFPEPALTPGNSSAAARLRRQTIPLTSLPSRTAAATVSIAEALCGHENSAARTCALVPS